MNVREKIEKIINGRVVGVIARGSSLNELEKRINEFKDLDICWTSLNLFTIAEEYILSKINKKLEIISDCSNVELRDNFEPNVRRPRFENYLKREDNNLLQISNTVIRDLKATNQDDILEKYKNKIITIDEVFTGEGYPIELWDAPPNSITLLFAMLMAGKAKKVVTFGFDGYTDNNLEAVNSYYKPELEKAERIAATGKTAGVGSLPTDSRDFNRRWFYIYQLYKRVYGVETKFINCSPITMFNCMNITNYDNVIGEIR